MPVEVILPRVDMDMATGRISKWLVKEGDAVAKGAPLFEIETDKAAMEVESPGEGIIRNITAPEGAVVPVGTPVAFIHAPGEPLSEPASPKMFERSPAAMMAQPSIRAAETERDGSTAHPQPSGQFRATPLARRFARMGGVALGSVIGSGPRGRILAEDVRKATGTAKPSPSPAGAPDDAIARLYAPGSYDVIPIDGMRRTIARRLLLSQQTVPQFQLSVTCDLGRLSEARNALNSSAPGNPPALKLSVNDFVIKALALALKRVPQANVTWTDGGILMHRASDVGVAVAIGGGLLTPVIRSAEAKPLPLISQEMKALAARARARKLVPSEYQGGTTTISNLGMFAIEQFSAIVNLPHATILAVGAAIERPAGWLGRIELRSQMVCTLTCDHRVIDGALGAELLATFRSLIEEPALMLA